jgi:excisionase family DNA binding protein
MSDRLALALEELAAAIRAEMAAETRPPDVERLLSVAEAAKACGVGRTRLYGELEAGRLRSIHVGRRRLISAGALAEYTDRAR